MNTIINNNSLVWRICFLLPGISYLAEFFVWKVFPPSPALNGVLGGLWTLGQFGIMIILYCMYQSFISHDRKINLAGVLLAGAGAVSYTINYLFGYWLHLNTKLFLPAGALFTGIGMIVTGTQILLAKRWNGSGKFMPLAVGFYPFLVMFPILIFTGHPDLAAILGWGIPWLLLGIAMSLTWKSN